VSDLDLRQRRPLRRALVDMVQTGAEVLLLFLICSALLGGFEIHQNSMEPTFHEGQRVIVSKLNGVLPGWLVSTAHAADGDRSTPFGLHRGEIVVFESLTSADETLIKRVIGLPGDTVEIRNGAVYMNGLPLDEPYVYGQLSECIRVCEPITLAPNSYFVMGDNRVVSLDSRSFGPVPAEKIVGKVLLRYWPFDKLSLYE
jgi:signal peptidase I